MVLGIADVKATKRRSGKIIRFLQTVHLTATHHQASSIYPLGDTLPPYNE